MINKKHSESSRLGPMAKDTRKRAVDDEGDDERKNKMREDEAKAEKERWVKR